MFSNIIGSECKNGNDNNKMKKQHYLNTGGFLGAKSAFRI